jgi:hypothetical protein
MTRDKIISLMTRLRDLATKVADDGDAALATELRSFAQVLEDDLKTGDEPDPKKP